MASRGSTRLSQPHAELIAVDKLDAGLFESGAHDIDSLAALEARQVEGEQGTTSA